MTNAYVKIGFDFNEVLAISTSFSPNSDLEVVLDDNCVDFSKSNGYVVYVGDDGLNHLKFDEDKYNQHIKEQQRQESIAMGQELREQLLVDVVLDVASDNDAYVMRYLYPTWEIGIEYKKGKRFMYKDKFYKVLQDHTSQEDWLPTTATSLYVEVSDSSVEYPEFKQPIGAQDAYAKGDKVTFEGKKYVSLIDANVYSPKDYPSGWQEVNE